MKVIPTCFVAAAAVLAACGTPRSPSTSSVKSEYPSDYSVGSSCQTQGPVRLCRALQPFYGVAVVDLTYTGDLDLKTVSAFVKVNDEDGPRQGTFAALHEVPQTYAHVRITGGCLVGELGGCATAGTAQMRDLLQWAVQATHAYNALDIEVALVDASGKWDSRFGANYVFHFNADDGR